MDSNPHDGELAALAADDNAAYRALLGRWIHEMLSTTPPLDVRQAVLLANLWVQSPAASAAAPRFSESGWRVAENPGSAADPGKAGLASTPGGSARGGLDGAAPSPDDVTAPTKVQLKLQVGPRLAPALVRR